MGRKDTGHKGTTTIRVQINDHNYIIRNNGILTGKYLPFPELEINKVNISHKKYVSIPLLSYLCCILVRQVSIKIVISLKKYAYGCTLMVVGPLCPGT